MRSFARKKQNRIRGKDMNQQDYFKVVYGRDKTALKKEFVDKIVTETEREDVNPIELRMRVRAIKAQFKQDKKALKQESKRLEKGFRKEYGMMRRPFMAGVFDVVEEQRAVPNGRTPFNDEIKVEKDVVYKTVDGKNLCMDIYFPSRPVGEKSPVVLDIPGGGWMIHNRRRRDGYARCFAAMGAVVAVIDHRLCPEVFFPKDLEDCVDAYNFLCDHEDEYKIDKNNITLTGDSSGGHLAACMGCLSSSEEYRQKLALPKLKTKVANIITISGAFSFEVMYRIPFTHLFIVRYFSGTKSRKAFRQWEFYKESDPYNYLNPDFPETYNNGGATDPLCFGEAKRMAKALDKAGVKNEYRVGKNLFNSAHCYVLRFPFAPARKDALALYAWYGQKQAEKCVNMADNFKRVETFMNNYKKALKGKIKC